MTVAVALRLAAAVRASPQPLDALAAAADVLSQELAAPVAAWSLSADGSQLELVAAVGLTPSRRRGLVRHTSAWPVRDHRAVCIRLLTERFRRIARASRVTVVDVEVGLLLVSGSHPALASSRVELACLIAADPSAIGTDVPAVIDLTELERERSEKVKLQHLTPREREVLSLLVEGYGTPRVARELGISPKTVKTHVQNILAKLDVESRLAAVALAIRNGAVSRR